MAFNLDKGTRRRSSSSSDSSSCWSAPNTPTPIRYAPLIRKGQLQPGPHHPSTRTQKVNAKVKAEFSFTVPIVKRRSGSSSFRTYRAPNDLESEDTDTDTDGEITETELGTALSDVESHLNNPSSESGSGSGNGTGGGGLDVEGDEVDMVLLEDNKISPSPAWFDRKGKKRAREYDDEDMMEEHDGDDEMETEVLLNVRQKGKRPSKYSRKTSSYPQEKASALRSNFSVVGNICDRMGGLHASSTIIAMNVDVPLAPSSSSYPTEKHPYLVAYDTASKEAGAGAFTSTWVPSGHSKSRKNVSRKRGQPKKCFQQLTASEDPFVNLPAFQNWQGVNVKSPASSEVSAMDISDTEDQILVDEEMITIEDITAGGNSDIDMKSISSNSTHPPLHSSHDRIRIREKYDHTIPLAKIQLDSIDRQSSTPSGRSIHHRHRLRAFPERAPGQKSTSHLHRTSPSSLLPYRIYMTRSHKPPAITPNHKNRSTPGRVKFGTCITGQSFLSILRAKLSVRRSRRQKMSNHNAKTQDGDWNKMVGKWWGHEQVSRSTNKWWLLIRGPDEVEVEALLLPVRATEDEIMLSPPSSPEVLNQSRKRVVEEATDDLRIGEEVEERWSRRNQLRQQELQSYCSSEKLKRQARRAEQRRVQAAEIQRRLAEVNERLRVEEVARREAVRLAQEEQARLHLYQQQQARLAQEAEAERIRQEEEEANRLAVETPPSPAQSETSLVISDPPEYEFPFYPVVLSRPTNLPSSAPRRRVVPTQPDHLPAYLPDRWNNRSPPPPPPYNARTDCHTLIAPVFIEDSEDEHQDEDDEDEDEDDEPGLASPLVSVRREGRGRFTSPEPRVIGSFPSRRLFAPTPIRANIDPIRAFEAALDLEEGAEEDEAAIIDDDMDEDDTEEDVIPGGRVAGMFQSIFGMVWSNSSVRR
ncbi:uncharacterized protein IL334_005614 [Kwoniella shivajii]|uniref:Uncharacterized protein n=1 Tax=Kwoniella shivajii TaxID=564305 RepID=A0ABZ1D3L9_9TREE|nr:hypothetical protein IL334_005614 [Kwoniella shivajii]